MSTFTIVKRGPQVIDEDKFRFDMFVLLIEEWLRRNSDIRKIISLIHTYILNYVICIDLSKIIASRVPFTSFLS